MKYFTFLYLFILDVNLLSSASFRVTILCQPYIFTYQFSTLFLTPSNDTKRAIPFISGSQESNLPNRGIILSEL